MTYQLNQETPYYLTGVWLAHAKDMLEGGTVGFIQKKVFHHTENHRETRLPNWLIWAVALRLAEWSSNKSEKEVGIKELYPPPLQPVLARSQMCYE